MAITCKKGKTRNRKKTKRLKAKFKKKEEGRKARWYK